LCTRYGLPLQESRLASGCSTRLPSWVETGRFNELIER